VLGIHNSIVMQGAAPSQAALQGTSQGQHPAAPSRLACASGPANVAATEHESSSDVATASPLSVAVQPASIVTIEPAASIVAEPASMANVEPAPVVDSDPALPGAELTGDGAAEPACLVAGSAAEEEAKEATGVTPIVNHMVESTVRKGGPLCRETGLIAFVSGGVLQPCAILVKLTHTSPLQLARIGNVAIGKFVVDCCQFCKLCLSVRCDQLPMLHCPRCAQRHALDRGVLDLCSRHTCNSTAMLLGGDAHDMQIWM